MFDKWSVIFCQEFAPEFNALNEIVKVELLARIDQLTQVGPELGRPYADTLKGSKHSNMKELRFNADNGVWRVAFAFDPTRQAIILIAGDKVGKKQKKFYQQLIKKADDRFDNHLENLEE